MRSVVARFVKSLWDSFELCDQVEKSLKTDGTTFMHNDHLGYVLTCPSNLGSGLEREVSLDQEVEDASQKDAGTNNQG